MESCGAAQSILWMNCEREWCDSPAALLRLLRLFNRNRSATRLGIVAETEERHRLRAIFEMQHRSGDTVSGAHMLGRLAERDAPRLRRITDNANFAEREKGEEQNKQNEKRIKAGTMRCSASALIVGAACSSTGGGRENYDRASRKGKRKNAGWRALILVKSGEAPGRSPGLPNFSRLSDRACYLKDFTAVASSSFTSKTV
jgi:hypothetical protein